MFFRKKLIRNLSLIISLLLVSSYVYYSILKIKSLNKSYDIQTFTCETKTHLYEELIKQQFKNNSTSIKPNINLTGLDNKVNSFKNIVGNSNKLIIRNSETGCGMCIENELKVIKEYLKSIGLKNIILITTHNSARKLEVFKKMNNIEFDMYFCDNLGFYFEIESEKPFIFTIGPDLIARNFFIPNMELPKLSEYYYSEVVKLNP